MDAQPGEPADFDADVIAMLAGDARCPACGTAYAPDGLRLMRSHAHDAIVLAMQCSRCGTGSMVTVSTENASLSAELTPGEAFHFSQLAPLTDRDLLHVHELLSRHRGDLIALL
jgi:ribosomal protein S27AE